MPTGEPVGVTAVIDGMNEFKSNADSFNNTLAGMGGAVQSGAGIMSSLGDIAKTAIGYAVGTLAVDAFNKVKEAAADFFNDALAGEQQQAQLAIQVRNANEALAAQAEAYANASTQTVTGTKLSAEALDKLNDKYTVAKAKLDDMLVAYPKLKHPTETQTLNLQLQREKVDELSAAIAAGSEVITTNVETLNKLPLAAGFTIESLNKLADTYKDLVGGSDEAVTAIEMVGLKAGSVSAEQMPEFIQRVADLGAVMGDTSAAALLLARANEDPVAAMNRANRAGIIFDATLKEQIKSLVKHNDTAGATALVLDRIAQATAGAAAANATTLAGRIEILKNHLADMGKGILLNVLPSIEKLFDQYITPNLPKIEAFAKAIGDQLGKAIDYVAGSFNAFPGDIVGSISDLLYKIAGSTGISAFNDLGDALVTLPGLFAQLQAAIQPMVDMVIASLPTVRDLFAQVWGWIVEHKDEIIGAFVAIGAVLAGAGIAAAIAGIAATIAGLVTPVGLVIAAVGILGAAWAGDWGGIREIVTRFWNDTALPILTQLWTWLQVNVPIALQTLSTFWTTVLLPAINQVWTWIQANVFPMLANLWVWLQTNIPIALQTLANFWTNTLHPAILAVWAWIQNPLMPTLSELWTWLSTTLTTALQTLADFWTGTLLPAILAVYNWLKDPWFPFVSSIVNLIGTLLVIAIQGWIDIWNKYLSPAIHTLYDYLNEHVVPLLKDAGDYLNKTLTPAFGTLNTAVQWLVDHALAAAKSILDGVNQAIRDATAAVQGLINWINSIPGIPGVPSPGGGGTSASVSGPSVSAGAMGGASYSSSSSTNYNYSPTYGQGPVSPAQDFAIMGALAT